MAFSRLKRSPLPLICALSLGLLSLEAWSWGFGRAQSSAVLGASLDFVVGLRLEAGEAPPECLAAEVTVGDVPLPRSVVSVAVETSSGTPLVRVRTSSAIDEPLVLVNLSAGCSSRIARSFTLLADPPGHMAAPALASVDTTPVAVPPVIPVTPAAPAANTPAPVPPPPAPAPPPTAAAATDRAAAGAAASPGAARGGTDPQGPAAKAPPPPPRPRSADPSQLADAKAGGADKPASAPAARPRLQLEAPVVAVKPPAAGPSAALKAAEEAASSARAAASAAEARALALERNLEALRQEAKANREALARLTQALKDAQGGASSDSPALWGALAGLAALTLFLLFRQRRLQQGAGQAPWWSASSAANAEGPTPDVPAEPSAAPAPLAPLVPPAAESLPTPEFLRIDDAGPGIAGVAPAPWSPEPRPGAGGGDLPPLPMPEEFGEPVDEMERTRLLPPSAASVSAPISSVSIEELLDLEQQVEFFTVLGQDDSALNLLVEHLRNTGGTYPLPYLKLLEIYRRKGDEESYERTRDRFNQRFNAVAPAWGATPSPDRHLEDVPEVLERIQQAWPRPVNAMALLENMLVRTEGGTLLELTALGEVLFLFTLARDLHEQEVGGPSDVDVLLPFDDMFGAPASPVAPAHDSQATQFAPSMFGSVGRPAASSAAAAGLAIAAAAAQEEVDHFDLPLGEPMFEPVFDAPPAAPDPGAGSSGQSAEFKPAAAALNIDLPMFDLGSDQPAQGVPGGFDAPEDGAGLLPGFVVPPGSGSGQGPSLGGSAALPAEPLQALGSRSSLEPLELDLSFDDPVEPAPAAQGLEPSQRAELPNFDLPDLELPVASRAAAPAAEPSVDLDISLDGLELEPMAPKLTPSQEQAASNFGLFNETPAPGKPR